MPSRFATAVQCPSGIAPYGSRAVAVDVRVGTVAVAVAVAVVFEVAVAVAVAVAVRVPVCVPPWRRCPEREKVRRLSERSIAQRSVASLAAPRSGHRRHGNPAQRGAITGVAFFGLLFLLDFVHSSSVANRVSQAQKQIRWDFQQVGWFLTHG
jgi:hypothetical protein